MAVVTPTPKMQFLTAEGTPLVGGRLYTYIAGTTTPQATYTDETGSTANTNPIILDSRGEANVWLGAASYKFILADADDVEIWSVDYITAPTTALSPVLTGNVTISTDSSGPSLKITQTGTGPVLIVQDSADPDVTPFIINSTGLVGLGTISPTEALDIDNNGKIQFSAIGVPRTLISATSVDSIIDVSDSRNFVVRTNNNTRLTISGSGTATFGGALVVSSGGLTVSAGGLTITGGITVTGNSTVTGTLTSTGALTVSSGGAAITGNSTVTGTFGVTGTLTAQTGLTVSAGGAGIAGGLTVSSGGAAITGNSTVTGTLGVSSTLTVSAGGAAITGNSSVTGTLGISSALTVSSGGAAITGNSSVNGTLTATTFSGAWANIPSGTVMLFVQTSAPTGWTKSTAHDNKALRVVSGSASSGGSVAFTTAFASQAVTGTVASYTLTTSDIPSHNHSASSSSTSSSSSSSSVSDPGHAHSYTAGGAVGIAYQAGFTAGNSSNPFGATTGGSGTGISVSTTTTTSTSTTTSIGNTGGGGGHAHGFSAPNINLAVQYVDVIIATKD